jgi:hypothetical protein
VGWEEAQETQERRATKDLPGNQDYKDNLALAVLEELLVLVG